MSIDNETLRTIIHRKSIRHFKKKPVSKNLLDLIILAGQRAPTADNMQMYSFILVSDKTLRRELINLCEKQKSVKEAPVIIVFCADIHRITQLAEQLNVNHCFKLGIDMSPKFFAIFDACFAIENMVIAAESLELGSVMIGNPFENISKITELLHLPKGVIPISLLCIGYPAEEPKMRPRWPMNCVFHKNFYREISNDEIENYILLNKKVMDEEIEKGYLEPINKFLEIERNKKIDSNLRQNLKKSRFFIF